MQIPTLNFQLPEWGPESTQYVYATAITATTSYVVTKSAKTTAWRNGGIGLLAALSPYIFKESKNTSELVTLMLIYSGFFSSFQHLSYLGYNSLGFLGKLFTSAFSKQVKPDSIQSEPDAIESNASKQLDTEILETLQEPNEVESEPSAWAQSTEDGDLSNELTFIFLNKPTKNEFVERFGFQKLYEVLNHEKVVIQSDGEALRLFFK